MTETDLEIPSTDKAALTAREKRDAQRAIRLVVGELPAEQFQSEFVETFSELLRRQRGRRGGGRFDEAEHVARRRLDVERFGGH